MQTQPEKPISPDQRSLLEELETIAGDVRVRIHLAGMDIKDEWNKLEPQLLDARTKLGSATDASKKALEELVGRIKKIRAKL